MSVSSGMVDDALHRRILVVDDEERMVRFIRLNLEHDGFQVFEAFRGLQAIQAIRDKLPDLVLLDVMLPDLDGFEVLEIDPGDQFCPGDHVNRKGRRR